MTGAPEQFIPAMGMANPHVQTILSSVARKVLPPKDQSAFNATAIREVISVDGVQLAVDFNIQPDRPLIMIIPGWLGSANSSYVLSSATELAKAGYATARINLRDHGDTAHLNEGMFNSALIDEVVALVSRLITQYGAAGAGVLGYSLGGNFALRVARALPGLSTLAICPAIAPGATMYRIDRSAVYQRYFVQKWRRVWREKQLAFPNTYDFGGALKLNTVGALTDYFVRYHSDFSSTAEYFQAYDLSMQALRGVEAHILAANDDPIIPVSQYDDLPDSLTFHSTPRGGHGGYLDSWRLSSWADKYAIHHFNTTLTS